MSVSLEVAATLSIDKAKDNNLDIEMIKEACLCGIDSDEISEQQLVDIGRAVLSYISFTPDSVKDLANIYTRFVYISLEKYPQSSFFIRQHKAIKEAVYSMCNKN